MKNLKSYFKIFDIASNFLYATLTWNQIVLMNIQVSPNYRTENSKKSSSTFQFHPVIESWLIP